MQTGCVAADSLMRSSPVLVRASQRASDHRGCQTMSSMQQHTTPSHGIFLARASFCLPVTKSAYITDRGGIALLAADADPATSQEAVDWTLLARLPSSSTSACAHSDIVRCIEWDDTVRVMLTAPLHWRRRWQCASVEYGRVRGSTASPSARVCACARGTGNSTQLRSALQGPRRICQTQVYTVQIAELNHAPHASRRAPHASRVPRATRHSPHASRHDPATRSPQSLRASYCCSADSKSHVCVFDIQRSQL